MLRIEEMINHVKRAGVFDIQVRNNSQRLVGRFFRAVEQVKPFLLMPNDSENTGYLPDGSEESHIEFSSPFDCISIEIYGKNTYLTIEHPNDEVFMRIKSLVYNDISEDIFAFSEIVDKSTMVGSSVVLHYHSSEHEGTNKAYRSLLAAVKVFIDRINREKTGKEEKNISIAYRHSGSKIYKSIDINSVIYISPDKSELQKISTLGNKIDYSHRFFRRGHWMKQDPEFIGKDRHGVRNQKGRTWRVEAEVGDKSLPLINKTRVVLNAPQT